MALPVNRPLNIERVYAHLADASTAGSAFATASVSGKIVLLDQGVLIAAPEIRLRAIAALVDGSMPKGQKIGDDDATRVIMELSTK